MNNKFLICSILLLANISAFAAEYKVIKSCKTELPAMDGRPISHVSMEVCDEDDSFIAKITEVVGKEGLTFDLGVKIEEFKIRAGVNDKMKNLNQAELMVIHAMTLASDPVFRDILSTGMDLSKIRSAKVYSTGEIGLPAILEAKDSTGFSLGSFMGTNYVAACK
jgi:hypothetical protein